MNNNEYKKISNKDFFQIVISTLVLSFVSMYIAFILFISPKLNEIEESKTSQIVVVDFFKIVSQYPLDSSPEDVEKLMVKVNDAIFKYKEAGYVVIDSSNLIGYPEEMAFPYELVLNENEESSHAD